MLEDLKREVYEANMNLHKSGLVVLTWGNVSGIDETRKYIVIKPSGVPYETMKMDDMVVCDLQGKVIEGDLNPSVDLPTHIQLYKAFKDVKGVVHTHSTFATAFAQANKKIIPLGTTQADTFNGSIPCTRPLNSFEVSEEYEKNTGNVIVEEMKNKNYNDFPGCLVSSHGVFAWSKSALKAVENALIIEECAKMAYLTISINPSVNQIPSYLLDAHYERKHGKNKYYGQKEK